MRRGLALVMLGFILFFIGPVLLAVSDTPVHPVVPVMIGFALMFAGGFAMAYPDMVRDEAGRRAKRGTVALRCPNCGASAASVDASGTATCQYCRTAFHVG
jgi:uncharacterized membrane protein